MVKLIMREILHFSAGCTLAAGYIWIVYLFSSGFVPEYFTDDLLIQGTVIGGISSFREVLDRKAGQSKMKTRADLAAWWIGAFVGSLFMLYTQGGC